MKDHAETIRAVLDLLDSLIYELKQVEGADVHWLWNRLREISARFDELEEQ